MKWFVFFLLLYTSIAWSDEVKIDVNPSKPVAGEIFQAYFRIFSSSTEEPVINFVPVGVEVVGKSNQGVSTKIAYTNGKISHNSREITIVYDLLASRPGNVFLRDISVESGGTTLRHGIVSLTVVKEPEVLPDVFVMADVSKKSLFLGEGVLVRYYIYSKGQITNIDVRKYPKLNSFLKRFIQETDSPQRVSVDGQMYVRHPVYSAKLFPEKVGNLKIDPLYVNVTSTRVNSNDPFSVFNMGRELRTKSVKSETVKLEVKSLPEPIPPDFSGLIGKHNFDIEFGQSKILVNQPLEIKLTVTGGGALENLEAPTVLKHAGLEEFESNGDLKILDFEQAVKTFEYTFLARENLNLPSSSFTLSYFDPTTEKYIPVSLSIPEIKVAGGNDVVKKENDKTEVPLSDQVKSSTDSKVSSPSTDISSPIFKSESNLKNILSYFNILLAVAVMVLVLSFVLRRDGLPRFRRVSVVPNSFKRGAFELGEFTKWLSPVIQKTGKSPISILKESPLPDEVKGYFIDLLNSNDYKEYAARKAELDFKYNSEYFKALGNYIESIKDASSSKS